MDNIQSKPALLPPEFNTYQTLSSDKQIFSHSRKLLFKYTPSFDVWVLGRQLWRFFEEDSVGEPTREVRDFITRMLMEDPEARPTITETIVFFKNLQDELTTAASSRAPAGSPREETPAAE